MESEWPQQPFPFGEIPEEDPEVRKNVSASTMVMEDPTASVNKLIEHHSNWHRLKLAVAVVLRNKAVLQKRKEIGKCASLETDPNHDRAGLSIKRSRAGAKGVDICCTPLTVQEFEEA